MINFLFDFIKNRFSESGFEKSVISRWVSARLSLARHPTLPGFFFFSKNPNFFFND